MPRSKTGAGGVFLPLRKIKNRLDWPALDQLAQNNPRPRQNKILRRDWTRAILAFNNPKLMRNHVPKIFPKNKLDKGSAK